MCAIAQQHCTQNAGALYYSTPTALYSISMMIVYLKIISFHAVVGEPMNVNYFSDVERVQSVWFNIVFAL